MSVIPPDPREMEPSPTGFWLAPEIANGNLRTRFEYASGQFHDVNRWYEEGTAPGEKGTLFDWVFEAEKKPPTIILQWSEVLKPNETIRYTHCIANTPFGQLVIDWKGWKDYPSYEVAFRDEWIISHGSLDAAKEATQKWFSEKISEIFLTMT